MTWYSKKLENVPNYTSISFAFPNLDPSYFKLNVATNVVFFADGFYFFSPTLHM